LKLKELTSKNVPGTSLFYQRLAFVLKGVLKESDFLEILPFVDVIEVYNSRCMFPRFKPQAELCTRIYNIAGTVGSDSHEACEVGRSLLMLDLFTGTAELRQII
jgi:PHP-associated